MDADLTIARLAATQHGVAARTQLLAAGVSAGAVDRRLARGLLLPIHAGVYQVAGTTPTWDLRIMAAVLAAGPGAVASHRAARYLHGLEGIDPAAEVTVPRARAPRPPGLVVHRLTTLTRADVELRHGIRRTRLPATLPGLASVVPPSRLEAALDNALARGLVSCPQLERRLEAAGRRGREGAGTLARMLAERSSRPRWTQSEFERRLLSVLRTAGVPLPIRQFEVRLPGGRTAFLDFAWPDLRLAIEANSYRHHASRTDWARDHTRNRLVIASGWRLVPVTWDDLVDRPNELVSVLLRALAS